MSLLNLDNLVKLGHLKAEPMNSLEFSGLLHSGQTRLKDAGNISLALESRFDLAYNAAHSLALAALRWHGYRCGTIIAAKINPKDLIGRQVIAVMNFPVKKVAGLASEVLVLASVSEQGTILLQPERPVPDGSKIA